jgi:hypothetical protein
MVTLTQQDLDEIRRYLDKENTTLRESFAQELGKFANLYSLTSEDLVTILQVDAETYESIRLGQILPTRDTVARLWTTAQLISRSSGYSHINTAFAFQLGVSSGYLPASISQLLMDRPDLLDLLDELAHGDHEEAEIDAALSVIKGMVELL